MNLPGTRSTRNRDLARSPAVIKGKYWLIFCRVRDSIDLEPVVDCAADEIAAAEEKLRDYIATKYTPKRRVRHIDYIPIADVLSIYLDAQLDKLRSRFNVDSESDEAVPAIRKFKKRIERLNEWWGAKMLGDVNGEACRSYTKKRGKKGGARRDLEDLRAAIGHHAAEGYHREIVKISLPEKGEPRDKWLTRTDAAKLIWTCWRYREMQKMSRGPTKGLRVATGKRPLRHLARFILIGIYSGSRAGAIAAASPIPAIGPAFFAFDRGIYSRRKRGSAKTNKRQPPVPIPPRLLAHLRRWHRVALDAKYFVEFNGQPVTSVKTELQSARQARHH